MAGLLTDIEQYAQRTGDKFGGSFFSSLFGGAGSTMAERAARLNALKANAAAR